jgi:hypothetical protein
MKLVNLKKNNLIFNNKYLIVMTKLWISKPLIIILIIVMITNNPMTVMQNKHNP